MTPNSQDKVTGSAVAPSVRRLRSSTLQQSRLILGEEVLPQNYGTDKKGSFRGTVKSLHGETNPHNRTGTFSTQSGGIGQVRMDGEQVSSPASIADVCQAAASGVGRDYTHPAGGTGDRARQSMGEEAAEVGSFAPSPMRFGRGITGSGREGEWKRTGFGNTSRCWAVTRQRRWQVW